MNYIFDFDGTMVEPLKIDYAGLRKKLNTELGRVGEPLVPLIDEIKRLSPNTYITRKCFDIIDDVETEAVKSATLNKKVIDAYKDSEYRVVLSRNGQKALAFFFEFFDIPSPHFISCRDNCDNLKPHIQHMTKVFEHVPELNVKNVCMIGDSWHDRTLASNCGCVFKDVKEFTTKRSVLVTSVGCAPAETVARSLKGDDFRVVGIDIQEKCPGSFICDAYERCPRFDDPLYWVFITSLIKRYEIEAVIVTHAMETMVWSTKKYLLGKCKVLLNDPEVVNVCDDKMKTYMFAMRNEIQVPKIVRVDHRPCISRKINGCGSVGVHVFKKNDVNPVPYDGCIVQEFITGEEYTIDVLSSPVGDIVNIVPKKRVLVKNGQAFTSTVVLDRELIEFAKNVAEKLKNKSLINIQVIRENKSGKIYLIEINPRFPTSIGLTIAAGAHIPKMMLNGDFTYKHVQDGLTMYRGFTEYFS